MVLDIPGGAGFLPSTAFRAKDTYSIIFKSTPNFGVPAGFTTLMDDDHINHDAMRDCKSTHQLDANLVVRVELGTLLIHNHTR